MIVYNDIEEYPCRWLRNLIDAGELPHGDVFCGSFEDAPLDGVTTFHSFAGIGGWPLAMRMAGLPDDLPIWTASLPCQPFSVAGKRKGFDDDRHLWPAFLGLVKQHQPVRIAGEQVESAVRVGWLDRVQADLEAEGYATGAVVLGAHSVGAPHRRQRIFWCAERAEALGDTKSGRAGLDERRLREVQREDGERDRGLGHSEQSRLERHAGDGDQPGRPNAAGSTAEAGALRHPVADAENTKHAANTPKARPTGGPQVKPRRGGVFRDHWRGGLVRCVEPHPSGERVVYRRSPLEPGLQPLADGIPGNMGAPRAAVLKGAGNAIVPQVAAVFLRAWLGGGEA